MCRSSHEFQGPRPQHRRQLGLGPGLPRGFACSRRQRPHAAAEPRGGLLPASEPGAQGWRRSGHVLNKLENQLKHNIYIYRQTVAQIYGTSPI